MARLTRLAIRTVLLLTAFSFGSLYFARAICAQAEAAAQYLASAGASASDMSPGKSPNKTDHTCCPSQKSDSTHSEKGSAGLCCVVGEASLLLSQTPEVKKADLLKVLPVADLDLQANTLKYAPSFEAALSRQAILLVSIPPHIPSTVLRI